MIQSNLVRIYRKIAGYFLVILFCGYLGSITFFPHTHIVEGITIVHSHPYKSHSENYPISHNHLKNGFLLIQFISSFIAMVPAIFLGAVLTRKILRKLCFRKNETIIPVFSLAGTNRPRAPAA